MNYTLLFITDGRTEYHERSWQSAREMLPQPAQVVKVDDSDHSRGFAGAIEEAWGQVDHEWVFHLEGDFVFHEPVPVARMAGVLAGQPYLAQLALKRQHVNNEEAAAGGIVELWPDEYEQRTALGNVWTEHRLFWTTNPSLYPAAWCEHGWPQKPRSEVVWTERLKADPDLRFAFWGAKFDPPKVEHIGTERRGQGY